MLAVGEQLKSEMDNKMKMESEKNYLERVQDARDIEKAK
jgi:hypothetical protein